ncbi:MAG: tyrosine-type recombinase/integrase [Candidatus Omnitrophica bacterium]|nr:tyrosine-type recombinase/integrase [Candidatus Omnitrophota bacterium]
MKPYVFCNDKEGKLNDVRKSFVNAVKKAGIKDFTFHDLKHTFASYLVHRFI